MKGVPGIDYCTDSIIVRKRNQIITYVCIGTSYMNHWFTVIHHHTNGVSLHSNNILATVPHVSSPWHLVTFESTLPRYLLLATSPTCDLETLSACHFAALLNSLLYTLPSKHLAILVPRKLPTLPPLLVRPPHTHTPHRVATSPTWLPACSLVMLSQ